jgi:DNA-binding transcriptional ArsR family regulator
MTRSAPPSDRLTAPRAAAKFAALGSAPRLAVLQALAGAGPEGHSIGALGQACGITGATLTHHLKILQAAGLVERHRQGRVVLCRGAGFDEMQALAAFLLQRLCADIGRPSEGEAPPPD